jgi:hypothetical protein
MAVVVQNVGQVNFNGVGTMGVGNTARRERAADHDFSR